MIVNILKTTEFAFSQIRSARNIKVHSVYQKTINLLCNGRLVSLHPQNTLLSPIGMLTDMDEMEFSTLRFHVGDIVLFEKNGFSIINTHFSFRHIKTVKTGLIPLSKEREKALCRMISDSLRLSSQNTVFCDLLLDGKNYLSSPTAVYAQKKLDETKERLDRGNVSSAADSLTKLIGLGTGLTPSGDDFICGALAALSMRSSISELDSVLKRKILKKINLTNDISGEFLRCACEGRFSQPLIELPCATCAEEILLSFSKIGHSSGADTLNGILFIFSQTDWDIQ